jgi:GTP-binding protein HflX
VLVANQLFATLDPTTRRIELPGGRAATLSDTVGFVSKLPHDLVEAFRSTLEEVARATVIVHVADASSDEMQEQIEAVRVVLGEIGAGRVPEVLALNKVELVDQDDRKRLGAQLPDAVMVSALTREGLESLLLRIEEALPLFPIEVTVLIPYGRDEFVAMLHRDAEVLSTEATDEGRLVRARVGERAYAAVAGFAVEPHLR